ncbi:hypothetical protein [Nocardia sp. NBC_01329]|nr:hypothetical protein OG405_15020 [Nocardia sp. NBC_01329]
MRELLDPASYLGHAADLVTRALAQRGDEHQPGTSAADGPS